MNTQLADRSFGDCEIPAISFLNGSAYFNIFDPYETAFITLVFHSVGTLLFATNHTQNVIETVRLFDDLDALRSDPDAFGFFKKWSLRIQVRGRRGNSPTSRRSQAARRSFHSLTSR
ncbi:MAG: hypothetical protein WBL55_13820 [Xanthobacteraceae bacterium]